jgi:hypothetical protein
VCQKCSFASRSCGILLLAPVASITVTKRIHPPRRVRLGWSDHLLIFYKEKTPVALCTRTSWEGVVLLLLEGSQLSRAQNTLAKVTLTYKVRIKHRKNYSSLYRVSGVMETSGVIGFQGVAGFSGVIGVAVVVGVSGVKRRLKKGRSALAEKCRSSGFYTIMSLTETSWLRLRFGISKDIDPLKAKHNLPMVRDFSIADCNHMLESSINHRINIR